MPVHMVETINKLARAQRTLMQELNREPTIEEIANEMEMEPGRVSELRRIAQDPVSLEMPLGEEEDSTLGDFVEDTDAEVPVEAASFKLLQEYLSLALEGLNDRERQVLIMRFGLADGKIRTLEQVGEHFKVTRERIRQIETKALAKLRQPAKSQTPRGLPGRRLTLSWESWYQAAVSIRLTGGVSDQAACITQLVAHEFTGPCCAGIGEVFRLVYHLANRGILADSPGELAYLLVTLTTRFGSQHVSDRKPR